VHEGRALAGAAPGHRLPQHGQAGQGVAAVDLAHQQVGKGLHEAGDAAPGGLGLHGDGYGIAVVFDHVQDGQPASGGGVEALPELAFRGRAVAPGAVDDLVPLEGRRGRSGDVAVREIETRFRAAHRLQELRPRRRGARDHVQLRVAPVRRHLASGRGRIVLGAHRAQQHVVGGDAEMQHQGPVAVVGVEPVVSRAQGQPRGDQDGLVPRAADLEEDLVLPLELDLLVVHPPGQVHRPVDGQQGLAIQGEPFVEGAGGHRSSPEFYFKGLPRGG